MLRWLRYQIRNYFAFNRKEVNGTIILILLMVLLLAVPFFYALFLDSREPLIVATDKVKLDSLVAVLHSKNGKEKALKADEAFISQKIASTEPFAFDPNTATVIDMQRLGMAKNMAERIDKYRSKGGRFRVKKDLMKIYGFPQPLFDQLHAYITLPDTLVPTKPQGSSPEAIPVSMKSPKSLEPVPFDLNKADTALLKSLRGIGSGYSRRIINYRNKLGGFIRAEQVKEVYGLEPETAAELLKYAFTEANFTPLQINLNTASVEELKEHPYISAGLARLIVAYRQQHGPYQSVEEVKNIKVLKEEEYLKIMPYLKIN